MIRRGPRLPEIFRLDAAVCNVVTVKDFVVKLLLHGDGTERTVQKFYGECTRFLLQFPLGGDSRCQSEAQLLLTKDRGTQCHELNRLRKADNLM